MTMATQDVVQKHAVNAEALNERVQAMYIRAEAGVMEQVRRPDAQTHRVSRGL